MNQGNLSRRGFLARMMGGLTAAGLPVWYSQELVTGAQEKGGTRPPAPSDRIVMAAIGTGTNRTRRTGTTPLHGERGFAIMRDAIGQGATMVATCDVDRPNAEFSAASVGRDCRIFEDYRELLRTMTDVDAVTIGTPDHWHAAVAIAAMRAGKDVYCEKPLTLTLNEGKEMVRVARETRRVLQTGSQQRSDARFRLACELVRNGRVGTVRRITTLIGDNPVAGPFRAEPVPEGLNWDFWLGPTPREEYANRRCHYDFRWWYQYSGGKMTDWGAHHNDIAQWALGMDMSGPIAVEGEGTAPSRDPNSFNCHPTFTATYTYGNGTGGAEGTRLLCKSNPPEGWTHQNNGILFEGDDGKWIFVNRGSISASNRNLLDETLPAGATRLEVSANHMANFLDCVRSRRQPICHVGVGHRSVSVCHLGNIAIRTGRRLRWDPREERFTGEHADEANLMLERPRRDPYRLPG